MDGLLHLVQWGGGWAGLAPPRPLLAIHYVVIVAVTNHPDCWFLLNLVLCNHLLTDSRTNVLPVILKYQPVCCCCCCRSMPRLSSTSASSRAEYPVNSEPPVNLMSALNVADRPTAINSLRFSGRHCSFLVECNVNDSDVFITIIIIIVSAVGPMVQCLSKQLPSAGCEINTHLLWATGWRPSVADWVMVCLIMMMTVCCVSLQWKETMSCVVWTMHQLSCSRPQQRTVCLAVLLLPVIWLLML